jgi:hypothetical protein
LKDAVTKLANKKVDMTLMLKKKEEVRKGKGKEMEEVAGFWRLFIKLIFFF